MSYSPPSSAKPFNLHVSDEDINAWRQLLQLSPLGPKTHENSQTDRKWGVSYKWLSDAKEHWLNTYDWRAQEKRINSFPNYRMQIEDVNVHFIGMFSQKKDAVPIIFMHGWPGSFIEFLPLCGLLRDKWSAGQQPYHIIVPSLPGYTLSAKTPVEKDWTMQDTARIMNQLMINLGFSKYIAQGGDVGSFVGMVLAASYDECIGLHLNMLPHRGEFPDPSTLTNFENSAISRYKKWRETGSAYGMEHGTRPGTIGHVLSSSPLALLAWIGEKMLEWTDEDPPLDTILTNVSLYWFTGSFPYSIYPYRTIFGSREPLPHIDKPTGFSWFQYELMPGIKSVLEKACNLVYHKQHERGGHFAALEKPNELWGDVQEFVVQAWKV